MADDRIGDVRLLIADVASPQVFRDEQIHRFLTMEGSVKAAAARALEVHATHVAAVAGPIRGLLDIRIGGEQSASILLEAARRLRRGRLTSISVAGPDPADEE